MSQIQDIKQANDIIQIIGERITLQRSGTNWRGLCPFHSEKSPSFFVSEQLQRYKCFGCGESGDVFSFLEKYEGMTFAETLQYLADRSGIVLTRQTFTDEDDQRKRVLELLSLAREYYSYLLTQHEVGAPARSYLKDRGISSESLKVFQLGYAVPSWDGILKYLHQKKKYSLQDIEAAGLSVTGRGGKVYDRFRERVMFPLTDHRGRVVGFSGRVLDPKAKEAKYINSPETMLYHKSQLLYGYSQLYQHIRKENEVVVVEGEFDVISSAQAHVNHVVAVKGSALTEDHMRLLSRTVERVLLSFDTDRAGIEATRRAIAVAKPFHLELRVLDFGPDAQKDPDELARQNPQQWRQVVKSSISVYEFLLRAALQQHDSSTPEGKRKIVDQLAPVLSGISHAVEREYYVKKLANALEVKEAALQQDILRFGRLGTTGHAKLKKPDQVTSEETPAEVSRRSGLERYLAFLFFHAEAKELNEILSPAVEFAWSIPEIRQSVAAVAAYTQAHPWKLQEFVKTLPEDLQVRLFEVTTEETFLNVLTNLDRQKDYFKEWKKTLTDVTTLKVNEEVAQIQARLDELDGVVEKTAEQEREQLRLLQQVVELRRNTR